ncbi:MAG: ABC transporter ATP-binding protein [Prevotella sp.]|nr:ABC transporter ATP-binding protein [Prevotella sp.]
MIELKDLTIGYAQKNNTKVVASNINATLHSGRLTCLIGANGIGKSTLLRTLSAFQPPLGGEIFIDIESPIPLSTLTDKQLSRLIGVVLTEKPDVQNMTVFELVGLGRSPYTGFWGRLNEEDKEVVKESLRLVGIESLQNRLIQTLSDGERQKTMIAKALAQQTPVIYLDEPTAFLDYPSKVEMLTLLRHLARETGKTIFLSTHDMELALQIADELWLMTATSSDTAETPSGDSPENTALIIGTPQKLAANGSLSHFIDRPGLHFDPQTLAIRVTNHE